MFFVVVFIISSFAFRFKISFSWNNAFYAAVQAVNFRVVNVAVFDRVASKVKNDASLLARESAKSASCHLLPEASAVCGSVEHYHVNLWKVVSFRKDCVIAKDTEFA